MLWLLARSQVLYRHLTTNHINVGEDLNRVDAKHWDILSGLTGVKRSLEETAAVGDWRSWWKGAVCAVTFMLQFV